MVSCICSQYLLPRISQFYACQLCFTQFPHRCIASAHTAKESTCTVCVPFLWASTTAQRSTNWAEPSSCSVCTSSLVTDTVAAVFHYLSCILQALLSVKHRPSGWIPEFSAITDKETPCIQWVFLCASQLQQLYSLLLSHLQFRDDRYTTLAFVQWPYVLHLKVLVYQQE